MSTGRSKRVNMKREGEGHFNVLDYIVPRVACIIDTSDSTRKTKGVEFEKSVAEVFSLLDFEVEYFGQGKGRNPDAIAKFREDSTAFIIDAKAYKNGYALGTDDRALYEYVDLHCPKLKMEGLRRIAFILVSSSFKSENRRFVNEITWKSEVRRFIFITSDALLYLLAYKTKYRIKTSTIIYFLISATSTITVESVIAEFSYTSLSG